jgi:hypothetical protein
MKTYELAIHAFVGGCIRCRMGSVSARSRKCRRCGGVGYGLVRKHVHCHVSQSKDIVISRHSFSVRTYGYTLQLDSGVETQCRHF